jgi:hypothetical protein
MHALKYLVGYPPHVLERVRALIEQGRLGAMLDEKYGEGHVVRSNSQNKKVSGAISRVRPTRLAWDQGLT